jgi:hypothetical protein
MGRFLAVAISGKEKPMKKALATLAAIGALIAAPALAAEMDWSQVDAAIGKKGGVMGTVHKYGLPRSDLHVTLDGVTVKPGLVSMAGTKCA